MLFYVLRISFAPTRRLVYGIFCSVSYNVNPFARCRYRPNARPLTSRPNGHLATKKIYYPPTAKTRSAIGY